MLEFKRFRTAAITIAGTEFLQPIRKSNGRWQGLLLLQIFAPEPRQARPLSA
jgi:hypothetical protein